MNEREKIALQILCARMTRGDTGDAGFLFDYALQDADEVLKVMDSKPRGVAELFPEFEGGVAAQSAMKKLNDLGYEYRGGPTAKWEAPEAVTDEHMQGLISDVDQFSNDMNGDLYEAWTQVCLAIERMNLPKES